MNVHITLDVQEHNALAALPPFVMSILSLSGLFSDGPPPPQWNICHITGLSVSPQEPKIGMLLTNKDMRVSNSPLSVMNPQFNYCFLDDGLTHNRVECQLHSLLQWWTLRTAWCVSRQRRAFVININFWSSLFIQDSGQEKIVNGLDQAYILMQGRQQIILNLNFPSEVFFSWQAVEELAPQSKIHPHPHYFERLTSLQMKLLCKQK